MLHTMTEENLLWKGSPSQWLNLGTFIAGTLVSGGIVFSGIFVPPAFLALALPGAYMLWRYLVVRTQVFELTSERLRVTRGVLNHKIDEIELYRVKDSVIVRPWWMRLTGLSSIILETSDRSMPKLTIPAILNGIEFSELLRKHIEEQRDQKRVREMDLDDADISLQ